MMSDREYATPFPILQAASLLSHKSRIQKFKLAIEREIRPDDYVIDIGTGSGILAILAAQRGARVTALDANGESLKYARQAALMNGVSDKIEFIHSHFMEFKPKERADAVICEMLSSVMLIEQQIPASHYARKNLLKQSGKLIPELVRLFAVPVENEILWNRFRVEDLDFPRIPQTADRGQSTDLADLKQLGTFDLTSDSDETTLVDALLEFEIVQSGTVHGLLGMFEAKLSEGISLTMEDGWRELFLPLVESIDVKLGDQLRIRLSFRPGEYDSLTLYIE
ncbi:methyltransferase domain-containing protein [Candidatus Thorarchaeota archaeon]|nr:MAG: methyltransferase domain-containing protein [Candidatus Thorarchaeota archaeon]